ncbi:MAG: hypothetical protein V3U29_10085, partial [Phycisphaeraceae bacterium]
PLARLMWLIERYRVIESVANGGGALNRWAAWEVDPPAMQKRAGVLAAQVRRLVLLAAAGDDTKLSQAFQALGAEHAAALLVVALEYEFADQLGALPQGPTGALSQLLFSPGADALLAAHRDDLALLCRCLNELAHPAVARNDAVRRRLERECAAAVARIAPQVAGLVELAGPSRDMIPLRR